MRAGRIVCLLVCLLAACGSKPAPLAGTDPGRDDCDDRSDGMHCSDQGEFMSCRDKQAVAVVDCSERKQICLEPEGCVTCRPGERSCDGNTLTRCKDDGSGYESLEECGAELACSPTGCRDLCAQARSERSYIGCEYFPVFTANSMLDPLFKPAVVIANPNLVGAHVTIERAGQPVTELEVAAGGVETALLNYVAPLRTPPGSALIRGGAYHLVSSVPVTVHQFNPLLFETAGHCQDAPPDNQDDNKCNSQTNDASLLLPAHVLARGDGDGTSYLVISRATMFNQRGTVRAASPGFVTIVGAGDAPVQVSVRSSAYTRATVASTTPTAASGDEPAKVEEVIALAPGESLPPVALGPGDVLQLLSSAPATCPTEPVATRHRGELACPLGAEYDLTGTEITADGPVAVIAGHNCAYVPFDRTACDHLEETMFPIETWGTEVVVPRPRAGDALPQVVRVVSALDDNMVHFEPEISAAQRLGRGQSFEFQTTEHVIVRADKPISVAQFLIGQNGEPRVGDPSMTIAIPTEQYRSRYAFLSPKSYDLNYVSLIAHSDDRVILDDVEISEFTLVGEGAFKVAAIKLVRAGAHEVHSKNGQQLGLQIYGYADYTSYMLPGGLDLRVIGFVW